MFMQLYLDMLITFNCLTPVLAAFVLEKHFQRSETFAKIMTPGPGSLQWYIA